MELGVLIKDKNMNYEYIMHQFTYNLIIISFVCIVLNFLFLILIRPVVLWYFRIDENIRLLSEIRNSLFERVDDKETLFSKENVDDTHSNLSMAKIDKPMMPLGDNKWKPKK